MPDSLTRRIVELNKQLNRLPEAEKPPPTTLQVLGRNQQERDWQRLLFYFLSPNEGHGLSHELLEHLLSSLSERSDLDYTFSRLDLHDIQVETEVVASNDGRPDAVLWVQNDWFICWELKLWASETGEQTEAYIDASSFQTIDLTKDDILPDNRHYIYLAPKNASQPGAEEFVQVSWEWLASELEAFLAESHGRYPARTTAQLDDFLSTITQELTMTEYQENQQEKARLYFEYYDQLNEIQNAFENEWDEFENEWGLRLAQTLDDGKIVEIPELPENFVAVDLQPASGETTRWLFRQGNSWAGIAKEQWRRRTDDGTVTYTKRDDDKYVHLTLYHRLEKNRERAIRDGVLELTLWHGTTGDNQFLEMVNDRVADRIKAHDYNLPEAVSLTSGRGKIFSAVYTIPIAKHDNFFDAYTAALRDGFTDLAVENTQLLTIIDEAFSKSLEEYYL